MSAESAGASEGQQTSLAATLQKLCGGKRNRDGMSPIEDDLDDDPFPIEEIDITGADLSGLHEDKLIQVAAATESRELVTANIQENILAGKKFSWWIKHPKNLCAEVLDIPYDAFVSICLENSRIDTAHQLLVKYTPDGKRSVSLKNVVEAMTRTPEQASLFLTEPEDTMVQWAPEQHWARFLFALQQVFSAPTDSIFDKAKIKTESAKHACLWVLSKIIRDLLRPAKKSEIENQRKAAEVAATGLAVKQRIVNATLDIPREEAIKAASNTIRALRGEHNLGPPPKMPKLDGRLDDLSEDDEEELRGEAKPPGPANPNEATDGEVIEAFLAEMAKIQQYATGSTTQRSRQERAARSAVDLLHDLRSRPDMHKAYIRDMALLHNVAAEHLKQIQHIEKPNKKIKPIYQALLEQHERNKKVATMISNSIEIPEERDASVLGVMAREEAESIQQRAERTSNNDDVLPDMVDIPKEKAADPSADLFKQAQNNARFNPMYLKQACIEACIHDIHEKLIPGTLRALRWWQIIATKWITDLFEDELTSWLGGGIIADMIGLGKTYIAAGSIAKAAAIHDLNHSPAMVTFNTRCPIKRPPHCPEVPGDKCRPSLYITISSLCNQAATELAKFSNKFKVVHIGGTQAIADGYEVSSSFPNEESSVWDPERSENLYRIYVVSYNYLAKYHGPQAYWSNASKNWKAYCAENGIPFKGFNSHAHTEDPENLPEFLEDHPKQYVRSLAKKFGFVFADECQEGLRNPSSYWRTVRWLRAHFLFLMSGYPAPRGMEDYGSYLRLLERPELRAHHDALCKAMSELPDGERPYDIYACNPYELDVKSPYFKYCFLHAIWKKWITPPMSSSFELRMKQGKMAQRALQTFVLRRDFDSALPPGSKNTIGQAMPPKHHYTVERMYSPIDQRIYTMQFSRWKGRLYTTHKSAARGVNVPAANARATRAIQIIDFLPLTGYLHVEVEAEKRPSTMGYGDGDDRLDEKYNKDRESWFYDKSALHQAYDRLPRMKPGGSGERLRWIFKTVKQMGCEDLPSPEKIDEMHNVNFALLVLKHSPKMQAILGLYMDWAEMRDEKVIFWFMTPIVQEIAQTVMELLGHSIFSVYFYNNASERASVAESWNNPKTKKRALFASALVFGTGHNLQKDSRVGVMVDTPDTDNREKQIVGRQYRGGQTLEVHFFRLVVRGSHAIGLLSDNLLASLASATAFIDYNPTDSAAVIPNDAPPSLVSRVTENFLNGFFRVPAVDGIAENLKDEDFNYIFVFSEEGLAIINRHRAEKNDPKYWPETLDWTLALSGIAARSSTIRLRRLAGFPDEHTEAVIQYTEEEVLARKAERMRENLGVDPDDIFLNAKTPKKAKPGDMSRLKDSAPTSSAIQFPLGEEFQSYNVPQSTGGESNAPNPRYDTLEQYDRAQRERINQIIGTQHGSSAQGPGSGIAGSPSSSEPVFEDDSPSCDDILSTMRTYTHWIPSFELVSHLTAYEKRKVTTEIKKVRDPNFQGFRKQGRRKSKKSSSEGGKGGGTG